MSARAASAQDAILDAVPAQVFEPESVDEFSEIVAATAGDGLVLAPLGGGTSLGLGRPLERYDAAVRMRRLNRIVDYAPEDQVIVVEAGVTLDELQQVLWKNRQRLAIDPPGGELMTIGGIVATNAYGPSSLAHGTMKDLIVGIEVVRADGAIARGGGKVVKNVAGFDLPKLMVGSLGTLAIVSKATFRLHPIPEKTATADLRCPRAGVYALVLALREAQLEPAAIVATHAAEEDTWRIEVRFEGFAAGVDVQHERALGIAAGCGARIGAPGRRPADYGTGSDVLAKASFRPDAFEAAAAAFDQARMHSRAYPARGTARLRAGVSSLADPVRAIEDLRQTLTRLGGSLAIERMPRPWYDRIDPWGAPPASFGLMRALKGRFDPERRLNRGRFVGGL